MSNDFQPTHLSCGRPIQFDYLKSEYPELLMAIHDCKCGYISDARFLLVKAYLLYYVSASCYAGRPELQQLKLQVRILSSVGDIHHWIMWAGKFGIFPFLSKAEYQQWLTNGHLNTL